MNHIFLIGMMGSGKTTTARELAKISGFSAVDLDEVVEDLVKKTVNQIFSEDGEPAFREFEKRALKKVISSGRPLIIGTGGGVVLAQENVDRMCEAGTIIYLKASFPVLWERIKDTKNRPLLKTSDPQVRFKSIFDARVPLYERAACHVIMTDDKTPKEVALEISRKLLK